MSITAQGAPSTLSNIAVSACVRCKDLWHEGLSKNKVRYETVAAYLGYRKIQLSNN